jgi:hypothetical protein
MTNVEHCRHLAVATIITFDVQQVIKVDSIRNKTTMPDKRKQIPG